ncbi:MAG: hypothetical protein JNG88_08650 [Phycisphaerales bacterium]|nr:hypothetical protein [Phycisphaerales bacterium]
MHDGAYQQAVIVRRGFFSSLATGFFMFLTVSVVCGAGLGFYGMNMLDRHAGTVIAMGQSFLTNLPDWDTKLPPILADALRDRRDPEYRDQIAASVDVDAASSRDRHGRAVVVIENNGKSTISFLVARLVLKDENGTPVNEITEHLATPFAFDDHDARGPLLPGSKREIPLTVRDTRIKKATLELTDVRTFVERSSKGESRGSAADEDKSEDRELSRAD